MKHSKGMEQLADLTEPKPHTQASIARELRVTREAVRRWATGLSRPEARLRKLLERHVGIPVAAWEEES